MGWIQRVEIEEEQPLRERDAAEQELDKTCAEDELDDKSSSQDSP